MATPSSVRIVRAGHGEILDHGKYWRLAPDGDPITLAEAIVLTMESPPDRRMLQERAAAFSVDRAAEQYLKILFDEGGHGCTFC